jgi:hypothetical protein
MLTLTWVYAVRHGFVDPNVSAEQSRYLTLRQLVTPAIFVISIISEYLFPRVVLGPLSLLLVPLGIRLVDRSFAHAEPETQPGKPGWSAILWRMGIILPWILVIGFAIWSMSL